MSTDYESGTRQSLEAVLKAIANDGLPTPTKGKTYLKWDRSDGGYVIFRANYRGPFGTLDVRCREPDGALNGPFCPITYDYLPWITRDLAAMLADGPIDRDVLVRFGKRELAA